jgi:hypothetical protein
MTVNYTWEVLSLEKADINDTPEVVLQTYWRLTAKAEDGTSVVFDGATPLEYNPNSENFLPFSELTEETVISWIKNHLVKDDAMEDLKIEMEEALNQLQQYKNKEEVTASSLPWSANTAV